MHKNYAITDGRKLKKCPECKRYKTGTERKCMCGYKWSYKKKIEKSAIRRSTDYVPIPELTAEEKDRSIKAMTEEIRKLIKRFPAFYKGERWDKYREPKQEETDGVLQRDSIQKNGERVCKPTEKASNE